MEMCKECKGTGWSYTATGAYCECPCGVRPDDPRGRRTDAIVRDLIDRLKRAHARSVAAEFRSFMNDGR